MENLEFKKNIEKILMGIKPAKTVGSLIRVIYGNDSRISRDI